jgi:hypothetical protein
MTTKAKAPAVIKTPAAVPARDAAIGTLINEAGQAAASMLAKCKEAAGQAAKQLDNSKPLADRISAVVSLYVADFTAAGHNVKALFVDALTLHAAAQTPVMVNIIGKDGKRVDSPATAAEAVEMSKHNMRDAAKQVRDAHGIGRKSGGGAKPKAKPAAAAQPAAVTMSEVDGFSQWLNNLEPYFSDAVFHGKIVARMIELGYTVNKAAKGRVIKGAASA